MNIFIGNLTRTTTAQDLRQLLEPYGTVDTIEVITDRETSHPCGFGFVEMENDAEAQAAIDALNGFQHENRPLTVNEDSRELPIG